MVALRYGMERQRNASAGTSCTGAGSHLIRGAAADGPRQPLVAEDLVVTAVWLSTLSPE